MKRIGIILLIVFSVFKVWSQQDPMYTQYMTNPLTINPSIAGISGVHNLSLISRKQWVGINGAPTTVALSYQGPFFNDKVGLGANLIYDRLGPVAQTAMYFDYAYKLKINEEKKSYVSLGLMGGFNYYQYNLLGLHYNGIDDDIPVDGYNDIFLLNFGLGVFYYHPRFFLGVSIPKILRNSLSQSANTLSVEDKEARHYFAMTGAVFILNDKLKFKPSVIARLVNGAPYSLDLNATFVLNDLIWLGGFYRVNNSVGAIIRWQMNDNLHIGYSYDVSINRFSSYNKGTHEVFISYTFGSESKIADSIRYF